MMVLQTIQQKSVENMLLKILVSVILKKKMVDYRRLETMELNVQKELLLLLWIRMIGWKAIV